MKLRFVSESQFNKMLMTLPERAVFVPYPWTIETLQKTSKNIFTRGLCDCIAGIVKKGTEIRMFHLCTRNEEDAEEDDVTKFDIENIENNLKQSIDFDDENTHALLIGGLNSVDKDLDNSKCFKNLVEIFDRFHVPLSIIGPRKDIPNQGFGEYSILYTKDDDTLYITDSKTETICGGEKEIKVTPNGIEYYIYDIEDGTKRKNNHPIQRVRTGIEDFLKSRFEEVKLCSFDEFA